MSNLPSQQSVLTRQKINRLSQPAKKKLTPARNTSPAITHATPPAHREARRERKVGPGRSSRKGKSRPEGRRKVGCRTGRTSGIFASHRHPPRRAEKCAGIRNSITRKRRNPLCACYTREKIRLPLRGASPETWAFSVSLIGRPAAALSSGARAQQRSYCSLRRE